LIKFIIKTVGNKGNNDINIYIFTKLLADNQLGDLCHRPISIILEQVCRFFNLYLFKPKPRPILAVPTTNQKLF